MTWRRLVPGALVLALAGCREERPPLARPLVPEVPQIVLEEPDSTPLRLDEVRRLACALPELLDLAVGPDDHVHVVGGGEVQVLGVAGEEVARWSAGGPVRAVAVAPDGEVYLGSGSTIAVHDPAGRRLRSFGVEGTGPGQLRLVTGLAIHGGSVLVADAGNRCVHRFDLRGDFVLDLGRLVVPSPYLGLAVSDAGILHVPDPGQLRVQRYRLDGELLGQWGEPGVQPGQFTGCCNPIDLALLPAGIATAEKSPSRVKLYSPTGDLLAYLGQDRFPSGTAGLTLAVDRAHRLLVADPGDRLVRVYEVREP